MKAVALGKAELQQVMDVMALTRDVASPGELRLVVEAISRLVPHEFGAIGSFRTPNPERLTVTTTTYHHELSGLYEAEGFKYDPAVALMHTTRAPLICSVDRPYQVPKPVEEIKYDFGVQTCLSVGVRGEQDLCTYFVCSNFAPAEQPKLRMYMDMLGPHLHLAYIRCTQGLSSKELPQQVLILSPKELEIVKWLCEGKTNWEIATITNMSERTVRFHLSNIFQRLGINSRFELIAQYAWTQSGLLPRASQRDQAVLS